MILEASSESLSLELDDIFAFEKNYQKSQNLGISYPDLNHSFKSS